MTFFLKSLVTRLTLSFLCLALITVIAVAYISYNRARVSLTQSVYDHLTASLELKKEAMNTWIDERIDDLLFTRSMPELNRKFRKVVTDPADARSSAGFEIYDVFQSMLINHPDFSEMFLLSGRGGEVLISSNRVNEGDFRVSDTYFIEGLKGIYVQDIYLSPVNFKPTITVAAPVRDEKFSTIGVLAAHLDLVRMDRIIFQHSHGETGETYLVDSTNTFVAGRGFGRNKYPRGAHSEGIERAINGESGTGLYRNYAGVKVVGVFKWIPEREMALIAEIHQSEAFYSARRLASQILILGLVVSLFLALATRALASRITRPILAVKDAADMISMGDRVTRAPVSTMDEVGALARAFNRMVDDIQESEERFRTIFETTPDSVNVFRLSDSAYVSVNREFEEVSGYTLDEVVGRTTVDVGVWANVEDRDKLYEILENEGRVRNLEVDLVMKDGAIRTGLVSADLISLDGEPHLLSITRDISKLKEAERAARESERLFRTFFEHAAIGMAIVSLDLRWVRVNDATCGILGYTKEELYEMSIRDVTHPDDLEETIAHGSQLDAGNADSFTLEKRYIRKDGTTIWVNLTSAVLRREDGSPDYYIGVYQDINDRKIAEHAHKESEERFKTIFDTIPDAVNILRLSDQKHMNVNKEFERFTGYTRNETVGMTTQDLEIYRDSKTRQEFYKILKKEGKVRNFEADVVMKDYAIRTVLISADVINLAGEPHLLAISRDITKLKEVEKGFEESEKRYRILFNAVSDAIIVFGIDDNGLPGKLYTVNDVACRMIGRSYQELTGLTLMDIGPAPFDHEETRWLVSKIIEEGQHTFEQVFVNKKGAEIPVEIKANLFDLYDVPIVIAVARDLTGRKRAEEDRKKIQARLIQANKMTSLGLMVSSLAHEINNPNNTIMFNLRRFAKTWDDILPILEEYYEENGDFIVGGVPFSELSGIFPQLVVGTLESSEMIKAIIENLKGFVRQSTDTLDFSVGVNDVVRSAISLLESQVRKGVGKLEVDLEEDLPKIRGNPQKLVQVMVNLISNALEALNEDHQRVRVSTSFDVGESMVKVSVADDGVGMTKKQVKNSMEPFYSTKLDSGGTGLGLTITKMLLDEHDAALKIVSTPKQGTTVTVALKVEG